MRRSLRIMVLFFTICLAFSFFPVVTGTAYASFEGGQLSSTTPYYARIKYSDAEIDRIVSSLYRKPREKEYLNEYFRGKIDFNGRAVYAYNSPDAGSTKLFDVADGEEVTVIAYYRTNDRYCVIVNSKNRACWINAAYISVLLDGPGTTQEMGRAYSSQIKYSDAEINQIVSMLYRKPKDKEYLDEYLRGKIDHNGMAVYAYNSPDAGSTKLFNVEDGEEITVVAYYKNRDRYCVIVNSKNRACWINAAYISLILEDDYSEPSPRAHESDTSNVGYSNAEINQIVSSLYRKPKDSEYLDEYYRGRIDHDGYSVYAYNSPDANAYKILDVEDGEEVTVIAYYRTNDRYCVIVNSKNRACWINAAYISLILSRNG